MKYTLLLIVFLSTSSFAQDKISVTKKSCASVQKNIDTINKKMRNKYTARQGESYREKLRKLYKKETQCRKKRYKTK